MDDVSAICLWFVNEIESKCHLHHHYTWDIIISPVYSCPHVVLQYIFGVYLQTLRIEYKHEKKIYNIYRSNSVCT